MIKEIKNTVPWIYVTNDLKGAEILGTFYEKELQKTNQKEFRIEKLIEKKGDKLYVKWKGYESSFNSWIDKNYLINYIYTYYIIYIHIYIYIYINYIYIYIYIYIYR